MKHPPDVNLVRLYEISIPAKKQHPLCPCDNSESVLQYCPNGGVNFIPDLPSYRRIDKPKIGNCIFKGCKEPKVWEDLQGQRFLCQTHFQIIEEKIGAGGRMI
jgi:hypothetical protein